ncbi:MAG: DUF5074 domain-containing protein [Filimonas sp.]|nr:DUF5074 domain-containing protein [Filimonas sp.]
MLRRRFSFDLVPLIVSACLLSVSCKKNDATPEQQSRGKYENGFFIVNEGWFGHENGSVNFYAYGADTLQTRVFQVENPGKDLGVTTEYATIHNGKLYLVSKQGAFVAADAYTLKETNRLDKLPADGRAFLGLDENTALLSTANGIYLFNLKTFTPGSTLSTVTGQVGDMAKANGSIYISQSSGVSILDANSYALQKKYAGLIQGFTVAKDGAIWTTNSKGLVRFNTQTLDTTQVILPFTSYGSWFAWNALSPVASSKEAALFMAKVASYGAGGNTIYKYTEGDINSVQNPFITVPNGQSFYGAALRYDAKKNQLVVTTVLTGYQENHLLFYDATTGTLLKDVTYNGYYFPALPIFNK